MQSPMQFPISQLKSQSLILQLSQIHPQSRPQLKQSNIQSQILQISNKLQLQFVQQSDEECKFGLGWLPILFGEPIMAPYGKGTIPGLAIPTQSFKHYKIKLDCCRR